MLGDTLGISLGEYARGDNFSVESVMGSSTEEEVSQLVKAMTTGHISGRETTDLSLTAEPLKVESLETTLKWLETRNEHIRLIKRVPKLAAYSTVEEYNQLKSIGARRRRGAYNEGELPDVEDSTYIRRAELVKFYGATGEVTHQSMLVRNVIDVYNQEVSNKTMLVLENVDTGLTHSNSEVVPQEFRSFYEQHRSYADWSSSLIAYNNSNRVYKDKKGGHLTQEDLEQGSHDIYLNKGLGTELFAPPQVITDFSRDFFQRQRLIFNAGSPAPYDGRIGTRLKEVATGFGDIMLSYDMFMARDEARLLTDAATSAKAPNKPTMDGSTPQAVVAGDVNSLFTADENGDTVFYAVTAINRHGESALQLASGTKATLATGSSVDLEFTATASVNPTTGFRIWRSKHTPSTTPSADGIEFFPLFEVSTSQLAAGYDGGAAGLVRDRNRVIPDTEDCFMIQNDATIWSLKQLAPLMKMDLAVLSPARRFMILYYLTPVLYQAPKMVVYKNVGRFVPA